MDIIVNKQKFTKILKDNKLFSAWNTNDSHLQTHCIIGLSIYLQFLETINPKDFSNKSFSKTPHIKLLRACSNVKNYDTGGYDIMGLKMAKEVFESLVEQNFVLYDADENTYIWERNDSYFISDIGIMLKQEIEECISIYRDKEIIWIKHFFFVLLFLTPLIHIGAYQINLLKHI